jgi:nucleolar protein 16
LGLVHKLNPTLSGGVEINTDGQPEVPTTPETSQQKQIPKGFGRIVRDGDGNVVRIELAEPEEEQAEEQGGLPEPAIDSVAIDKWVSQLGGAPQENKASNVVKGITSILAKKSDADDSAGADLESIAAPCTSKSTLSVPLSGVGSRHSSKGELAYLENLRAKYGTDVEAMSRDRKLNYMQRTVGELRKAFKRADSLL